MSSRPPPFLSTFAIAETPPPRGDLSLPSCQSIEDLAGGKVVKFGIESKRSCPTTSTEKFRGKIVEALREMREVCEKGVPEQKPVIDSGNSGKGQGQATAKL